MVFVEGWLEKDTSLQNWGNRTAHIRSGNLWISKMFWNNIFWTNETKVKMFGHHALFVASLLIQSITTYLITTVKHGCEGVVIWGCVPATRLEKCEVIETQWTPLDARIISRLICRATGNSFLSLLLLSPKNNASRSLWGTQNCYLLINKTYYWRRAWPTLKNY